MAFSRKLSMRKVELGLDPNVKVGFHAFLDTLEAGPLVSISQTKKELGDYEFDAGWPAGHSSSQSRSRFKCANLEFQPHIASGIEAHEFDYSYMTTYSCTHWCVYMQLLSAQQARRSPLL